MSLNKGQLNYLQNVLGLTTDPTFDHKKLNTDVTKVDDTDVDNILDTLYIKNADGTYNLGTQVLSTRETAVGKAIQIINNITHGDDFKTLLFENVIQNYFPNAVDNPEVPSFKCMNENIYKDKTLLDVIQSKYKCTIPTDLVKILEHYKTSIRVSFMFYKKLYEFIIKTKLPISIINNILIKITTNKTNFYHDRTALEDAVKQVVSAREAVKNAKAAAAAEAAAAEDALKIAVNNLSSKDNAAKTSTNTLNETIDLFIITIMNLPISFAEKIFLMQLLYLSCSDDKLKYKLIHAISNYDVYLFYVLARYATDDSIISLFKIFMSGKAGINDLYFDNDSEMRTKTAILDILSSLSSDNNSDIYDYITTASKVTRLDNNTAKEYQDFLGNNDLFNKYYNDLAIEFRVPVLLKAIRNNKELSEKLTSSYNKQDKTVLNILSQYGNDVSKLSTVAEKTILGGMNKRFTNRYQYGGDDMTEQEQQLIRLRDGLNDDAKYDQDKFGTDILFNCILSNDSERFGKCANTFAMSTLKMEILKKIRGFSNETKMALCKALDIQFVNGHIETYDSWLNRFYKEKDGKYRKYNSDRYPWYYSGYKRSDIRGKSINEIDKMLKIANIRARETVKFIVHMLIDSIMYVNGVSGTYRTDYQRYLNGYPHDETLTHSTWDDRLKTLHLRTKPQYTPPMPNPSLNRAQFNTILSYKPQALFGGQTGGGQNSDMFRRYFNVLKDKLPSLGFHMDPKDEKIFTEALDKYEEAENNLILSFRRYFFAMNNYKKVQEGHIGKSSAVSEDELREIYNQIETQSRLQVNGEAQLIAYLQKIQSILDAKLRPIKFTSYEQSHVDKIDQIV